MVGLEHHSSATVSKHLTLLRAAGLLESRKVGRWVYYRLSTPDEASPQADALSMVRHLAKHSPTIDQDRVRMDAICGLDPSEVARRVKAGEAVCPQACC
mgnify:CR=1 FL=1